MGRGNKEESVVHEGGIFFIYFFVVVRCRFSFQCWPRKTNLGVFPPLNFLK